MSTSDYNIERQPEIAIWPPKPEIAIPLELQQIALKFQRQVRDFRPWGARIKCRQVIATTTDNRKWQYGRFWVPILQFLVVGRCRNHLAIFCRARRHRKSRICRWNFDAIYQEFKEM